MRIEELEQALDRYGGDLGRWPAELREPARELIVGDRQAAALVNAAAQLDGALAEMTRQMAVDAAFMGRIAAGMTGQRAHELALHPTRRLAAFAGAAMVAFLVTGYAVGLALPASQGEDTIAGLMFGDSTASLTDTGSAL